MDENKQIWNDVLESLKVSVSPAIFQTWFSQTHIHDVKKSGERNIVEVGCSSTFVKSTIEKRFYGLIQDSLTKSLEGPCDLLFIVKQKAVKIKSDSPSPLFEKTEPEIEHISRSMEFAKLRPYFTFENFAVSSSNQLAWAASDAVSKNPGSAYNPLFIWGGVGVGKTHLMNAVGHEILRKDNSSNILFCTGEEFTNEIVEGIRNKTTQAFRNKYRKLKALLIDDIQFIAGKDTVQEEFFHTFNSLASSGSQIILTSDRPPSDIAKLEERLRSRFEAGLIVDIGVPDFELRCAIIQIKAKQKGIELESSSVHLIAGNVDTARKIEGFLTKLMSEALVRKSPINEELIELLLGRGEEDGNGKKIKANPNEVIMAVTQYFSIGKRSLLGNSRSRPVARPRQILMYLLRRELALTLQEVGRLVGGRDHTTVMHAVDKIAHMASEDVNIRQDIKGIKNLI